MYYNKFLRIWVIDPLDYFLLSAIAGAIVGAKLKDHLSEKKAMERLKNSMIKKSKLIRQSARSISNSKKKRIHKIYKFALDNRGGQLDKFQVGDKASNEAFKLAQKIKEVVEQLASFLKERELKGVAKIFFKHGRLILELILYKCKIDISYAVLTEELSTQVIVITVTAGGITGFTLSWITAGAKLVAPPLLITIFSLRSLVQHLIHLRDYNEFKRQLDETLANEELRKTLRAVFLEEEGPKTTRIKMKPWNSDKNPLFDFADFESNKEQSFEEFLKERMKEELGLIEDPTTTEQIKEIIQTRITKKRPKGKTVYFRDLIDQIDADDVSDNIIDAEIVKEAVKVKVKNEEL